MNRRQFLAATAVTGGTAIAAGGTWWFLKNSRDPQGASSRIDLLAGAYRGLPRETDPDLLVMLSITGGLPRNTNMEVRVFNLDGSPAANQGVHSATLTNLVTGEFTEAMEIAPEGDFWHLRQTAIQSDGWWQVAVTLGDLTANWTFLMPDPNLTGFGTPPTISTEPDAQAMLAACLNILTNRTSLRWWEWLSGGNGAIILARFSVTTPASNGLPAAFESDSIMAARIPLDGTAPAIRDENTRVISSDGAAMKMVNGGTPEPANEISYQPINEYDTTYSGYEQVHFGMTAEIEGRSCQLVAFHLPGQVEAWFAFWIDSETLLLRELFMLSVNHYMHWVYYDYDEPFRLEF